MSLRSNNTKIKEKLLILTYHAVDTRQSVISITPELFQWQMESLAARGLVGISLACAFDHLARTGSFLENSVVLTFDDGYRCLSENVLPVTQALGFSGTAFVIPAMIGLKADQARLLNSDIDRDMLDWSQIEELLSAGFEIGSHTLRHPDLTRISETELDRELGQAKQSLEQRLQVPVETFAYPYGCLNPAVQTAASVFYRRACTTRLGRNTQDQDPMKLRRVDAYFLRKPTVFQMLCDGKLEAYLNIRHYLRKLKHLVT